MDKQFWKLKEVSEIWSIETDVLLEMSMNEKFNLLYHAKGDMRLLYKQLGEILIMNFYSDLMLLLKPGDCQQLRFYGFVEVNAGFPINDIKYFQIENAEDENEMKFQEGIVKLDSFQKGIITLLERLRLTVEDIWVHQIDKKEFEEENQLDLKVERKVIKNLTKKGYRSPLKQLIDEVDQKLETQKKEKPSSNEVWIQLKKGNYDIIDKVSYTELTWDNGEQYKKIKRTVFKKYLSEVRRDRKEARNN